MDDNQKRGITIDEIVPDDDFINGENIVEFCKNADSKALAAHIVAYRLLHINQGLAKACMEELTIRANAGDDFDYETYIAEKLKQMPKPLDPEKHAMLNRVISMSEMRKR